MSEYTEWLVHSPEVDVTTISPALEPGDQWEGATSHRVYTVVGPAANWVTCDDDLSPMDVGPQARRSRRLVRFEEWVELDEQAPVTSLGLASGDEWVGIVTGTTYVVDEDPTRSRIVDEGPTRSHHNGAYNTRRYRRRRQTPSPAPTLVWVEARSSEPGTHCHEPGDRFRGYTSGNEYVIESRRGHLWVVRRSQDARGHQMSKHAKSSRAYCLASTSTSPSHEPTEPQLVIPRVTEVVCSSCGRTLGEWSDGSTPRSRRGDCCTNVPQPWAYDERSGTYTARVGTDVAEYDEDYEEEDD